MTVKIKLTALLFSLIVALSFTFSPLAYINPVRELQTGFCCPTCQCIGEVRSSNFFAFNIVAIVSFFLLLLLVSYLLSKMILTSKNKLPRWFLYLVMFVLSTLLIVKIFVPVHCALLRPEEAAILRFFVKCDFSYGVGTILNNSN